MWIDLNHSGACATGYAWRWFVVRAGKRVVVVDQGEARTKAAATRAAAKRIRQDGGTNRGDWAKRTT
jgi:hypothetical protein